MPTDIAEQPALYRDATAPVAERVADLLARMTLEEKIAQLHAGWLKLSSDGKHTWRIADFAQRETGITVDQLLEHGLGQITRPLGTHTVEAHEGVRAFNALQRRMIEQTRLGIPVMSHEECLVGLMIEGATLFPAPLNYGATWDADLVEQIGREIGEQARSIGCHQGLAPVLDVSRDPRWGRTEETFGEDPYLVGVLATQYVQGLQGERRDLLATLKHFAGHSASEGGRNHAPVHIGPREFNDIFLLPFEMAVKLANAGSVMPAYHDIDGIPCHADPTLIEGTLRRKWGFDGLVVADYAGVNLLYSHHGVADDAAKAAALAFNAGLDIELPGHECALHLKTVIERGDIDLPVIDATVSRVLTAKFRLGLFEHPYVDPDGVNVNGARAAAVAYRAAVESIVLLKNEGVLPLGTDSAKPIALIGPTADDPLALLAGYSFPVHLITAGEQARALVKTPLQAFKARFGSDRVAYAKGCDIIRERRAGTPVYPGDVDMARAIDENRQAPISQDLGQIDEAVRVAGAANIAVVFVGDLSGLFQSGTVGEGSDTDSLDLPGVQQALLSAVVATGTPTVVVQTGGRPYNLGGMEDVVAAHIIAFAPGEGGADALVELMSGAADFSGRLPLSIPKSVGAVPYVYNHKLKSAGTPVAYHFGSRYPFGFGLSYTEFRYRALHWINQEAEIGDGQFEFTFEVENVGARDGTEVVQIYVADRVASVVRPVRELKGFQRVFVPAGARRTVHVALPVDMLNFTDARGERIVEPGEFRVMIGSSSRDVHLSGTALVQGNAARTLERHWRMLCEVTVIDEMTAS